MGERTFLFVRVNQPGDKFVMGNGPRNLISRSGKRNPYRINPTTSFLLTKVTGHTRLLDRQDEKGGPRCTEIENVVYLGKKDQSLKGREGKSGEQTLL